MTMVTQKMYHICIKSDGNYYFVRRVPNDMKSYNSSDIVILKQNHIHQLYE